MEYYLIMNLLLEVKLVTRKITIALSKIYYGLEKTIYLGESGCGRDWGHAKKIMLKECGKSYSMINQMILFLLQVSISVKIFTNSSRKIRH